MQVPKHISTTQFFESHASLGPALHELGNVSNLTFTGWQLLKIGYRACRLRYTLAIFIAAMQHALSGL
jgi:hypothetical protein